MHSAVIAFLVFETSALVRSCARHFVLEIEKPEASLLLPGLLACAMHTPDTIYTAKQVLLSTLVTGRTMLSTNACREL